MSTPQFFRHGWNPDLPDRRDLLWHEEFTLPSVAALPSPVDLRANCSPIEDQGQLGSCTAHGIVGALEYLELKDKLPLTRLSRLFTYYNERFVEGDVGQDNGAQIRTGIKTLVKWGAAAETLWPYDIGKFTDAPPPDVFADGGKHKASAYYRLTSPLAVRTQLASGYPVVFGCTVYQSMMGNDVAKTGIIPTPTDADGAPVGGHCMLIVGYDTTCANGVYTVRNSWGENWGMAGYCLIPFEYLDNPNLADDFWAIRREAGL